MDISVGIRGLGMYLPPEVRRNDWWTPQQVARWMEERRSSAGQLPETRTEGERRVLQAMLAQSLDPFQGAVERHIMPDDLSVLDMEERAARAAITRAGIDDRDIDLLLTSTVVPDYLLGNPACSLHERLGLQKACLSMHGEASTFLVQLTLAEAMILTGRARCALLVQSCAPSRLLDMSDAIAPYFGDGATAAIVGRVSEGRGIASSVHFTDGRYPRTIIAGVPGARWYDEGRAILHIGDPQHAQRSFLDRADILKESVDAALAKANRTHDEVDFFCIHQGTPWMRTVVQEFAGLSSARSIETFARTGYVFASAQTVGLALAEEQGLLCEDDLVVLTGGGLGTTYGAAVICWGV